ncbi:3-hydroxyacyl-CoA dehydrogenase NAD-binding domain-containing protein [Parasulfitobacter algicola]|uniref:Enoyl-CoA hydratase/isomerase family protein n=1 Tax=Parasulfitobacter algicola TaxID=2614809 RepID=A0ABX2IZV9_9RHOB|nr:3-hydroxyacyl-CoA dehydrogenase NAD-binding domain-containing protein [Sulfitobacter algicola]NSX56346.1 enoyl-CoA hydratase/isomerase family protein [Sulfitobacter algicola]
MAEFTHEVDADGIATITWDVPGKAMNVMTLQGFQELNDIIDTVLSDDAIKGAVLTSGKKDFAGGMDLNTLGSLRSEAGDNPAQKLFDFTMQGHQVMRKIERAGMDPKTNKGGKPIACAMPGTGAGIGLELPLACHRIFVADNPKAKIGLPEILIGIFPGGGGTTRVVRKLGLMNASQFLMEGKMVSPDRAKSAGLVDEVVPANELIATAKEWVKNAKDADILKPWDQKSFKFPGGTPFHPAGFMTFVGASAMIHGKTQGVYPAAKAMLSAIYEGAQVPFDTALKIEARWFTNVLLNPSSSAMINTLFLNKTALEKGANRPAGVQDMTVKKVGVLGAGLMGAGIAYVSAKAGIEVVLLDQKMEAAEKGKDYSTGLLDKAISRKRSTPEKKEALLSLITPTDSYDDLKGCDLIVEAVFEDMGVKADVTKAAEAQLDDDAIFATNTSTLPITDLAKASRNDERFIGIHFFSPVDKMNLVEIIKGKATGDEAVAKALDFVRQIRKTPIVVNDERFFYANRCIIPYMNEGWRMVAEGVEPALVENAAKQMGMPLGPLQLGDETAVDLAVKIIKATKAAMGDAYPESPSDDVAFFLHDKGRLGKKTKAGFYDYDENGRRQGLWDGLRDQYPPMEEQPDVTEVMHRLAFSQTLEAVRSFEDGVLMDIREGDVAAILGWGFMPWTGGPFSYLDILGAGRAVEIGDQLTKKFGDRFEVPKLLRDLADSGETFYQRFGTQSDMAA